MSTFQQYCQNKVALHGSNFYYSVLFLPPEKREAITAIYAFSHEVNAIVKECHDKTVAQQKLLWWSTEVDRIFNGNPQHPVGMALSGIIPKYNLQKVWFEEILRGMAMDLRYQGYATFDDLKLYCHCVASTLGMLTTTVFGFNNQGTMELAKKLGLALQLVNIIRNVGEDARLGRIYIPENELASFGVSADEILQLHLKNPKQFSAILQKLAVTAKDLHAEVLADLPTEDRFNQCSTIIMAAICFKILTVIERSNFAVLNQKISITPVQKLWIAWRTWKKEQKLCHR